MLADNYADSVVSHISFTDPAIAADMSQWKKTSTSSQTDSNHADSPPGHKLPVPRTISRDVSGRSNGPHARLVIDRDVCVCVACLTHCRNNDALRKHGDREGHHPYGCVCGDTFNRLDVLQRHIASGNNVNSFSCSLCENARAFSRPDHLRQHLRTYHKIPAGRIPEDFAVGPACDAPAEGSTPLPPSLPSSILGGTKVGELTYTQQMDLGEHTLYAHNVPQGGLRVQQGPIEPVSVWTNNPYMQPPEMLGQYPQQNGFWQQGLVGVTQTCRGAPEDNIPASDLTFQADSGFGSGFNFGI
ncbi:hypothetical protein NUW58_g6712 [Xylaria curta]|uniref:Uncharacterized protein n=1 Tax=Xylaria curta TaxID=42375 RepID=A0ACC1NRB0_9PEZI|nr:hypothetical protein NUW58_g6712 [Xylaria curta]